MRHYLCLFSEIIRENWDRPALTDYAVLDGGEGNDYSYGDLCRRIVGLGRLLGRLGLHPGDHIAICGANSANWAAAYLAVAAFRGVSVTVMNSQTPEVIAQQTVFADCRAMFVDPDIWGMLPEDLPVGSVISLKDFSVIRSAVEAGFVCDVPDESCCGPENVRFEIGGMDDLAQICFTSGSTEEPKGVMLSNRSICNNVLVGIEICPTKKWESVVSVLPSAHVFGLIFEVLDHMVNANHVYFMGNDVSFSNLQKAFIAVHTCLVRTVPLILEQLYLRLGDTIKEAFGDNIQQIFVGGSSFRTDIEDAIIRLGLPLSVGYGSTETGPLISASNYKDYKPHSGGRVVSGMEARVSDAGEILVRGENVMLGYYKNPEATRRKIDGEGWLHTGDRGRVDEDGTVYVYGRLEQDIIVLPSGENVLPQNIEALLDRMDGVGESLVLERGGRLVALVYPEQCQGANGAAVSGPTASGSSMDKAALMRAVNVQLPAFSQIADIEFVYEPFQRTGKSGLKRYLYR